MKRRGQDHQAFCPGGGLTPPSAPCTPYTYPFLPPSCPAQGRQLLLQQDQSWGWDSTSSGALLGFPDFRLEVSEPLPVSYIQQSYWFPTGVREGKLHFHSQLLTTLHKGLLPTSEMVEVIMSAPLPPPHSTVTFNAPLLGEGRSHYPLLETPQRLSGTLVEKGFAPVSCWLKILKGTLGWWLNPSGLGWGRKWTGSWSGIDGQSVGVGSSSCRQR